MKGISGLDLESAERHGTEENLEENSDGISLEHRANNILNGTADTSQVSPSDCVPPKVMDDGVTGEISEARDTYVDDFITKKQMVERRLPNAVLPLLRYQQYESSDSSSRYIIVILHCY